MAEDFTIRSCGTLRYRQQNLQRALEGIARAGFQWVEIGCVCGYCEHITPETMDAADAARLEDQVASLGLKIASIAGHVDLEYPLLGTGAETARQGFDLVRARIELASHLQVGIVNTGLDATQDAAELQNFYRDFDVLLECAERRGVKIGLESHAGLTETAAATLALCRRMGRAGLDSQDPSAEIIDRGVAESFRDMKELGLEDVSGTPDRLGWG